MNSSNVDFYIAGFGADGKRVGSLMCEFDPQKSKNAVKLDALKKEAKELFADATVIEIISAEDFNKYISGDYIRGTGGKPGSGTSPSMALSGWPVTSTNWTRLRPRSNTK